MGIYQVLPKGDRWEVRVEGFKSNQEDSEPDVSTNRSFVISLNGAIKYMHFKRCD